MGADRTVDASHDEVRVEVLDWTAGEGPTVVVEATGAPAVLETAIEIVASSGTVAVVGLSSQSVKVPMVEMTRKELTIVGSRNNMGRFGEAVELVRRQRDRIGSLISHRFAFEQGAAAFSLAHQRPTATQKVIVQVGADAEGADRLAS
jgi:L-gulonate 5-dehydrogenase